MAFIVFEGLDGSGKSTLIRSLEHSLKRAGKTCVLTREPGGTSLGEEIRQMLLRLDGDTPVPKAELLLYEAGRAQHVERVIAPALVRGEWVLCDRFTASTVAFQSGGRSLDTESVAWLNTYAIGSTHPNLTVLLDLDVKEGQSRRQRREADDGQVQDRFEQESLDFHEAVRQSYLKQAQADPKNWLVLNASLSPEELLEQTLTHLRDRKWLES